MILNVLERAVLLGILPKVGDITTLRIVQELIAEVGFTEVEHSLLNFVNHADGRTTWDETGVTACIKEVEIGPKATEIIAKALQNLSQNEQLTIDHIGLWDKFVEEDVAVAGGGGEKQEERPPIPG